VEVPRPARRQLDGAVAGPGTGRRRGAAGVTLAAARLGVAAASRRLTSDGCALGRRRCPGRGHPRGGGAGFLAGAVPGRADRALLSDAGLGVGGRGRRAGDTGACLAAPGSVRPGPGATAVVAVCHRDQRLPGHAAQCPASRAPWTLARRRLPARRLVCRCRRVPGSSRSPTAVSCRRVATRRSRPCSARRSALRSSQAPRWIQAQAGQADDSNGLVTWNHLRKRRRPTKRLLSRPRMRSEPLRRRVTQNRDGNGTATSLVRAMDKHRGAIGSPSASQQGIGSLAGRCVIERHDDQRLSWSEPAWSPPPESNRRPHPYHGTTGNRCAKRRNRRSRPTVRAEVIGSPSARLCAHFHASELSSLGRDLDA
jgi:hypothetical protein